MNINLQIEQLLLEDINLSYGERLRLGSDPQVVVAQNDFPVRIL